MDDDEAVLERKCCDYNVKISLEMAKAGKGKFLYKKKRFFIHFQCLSIFFVSTFSLWEVVSVIFLI